jgi:dipeptidyl aminopeptidase/acylaminoacyl peptidase
MSMSRYWLVLLTVMGSLLAGPVATGAPASKAALTHASLWLMKRVGGPVVSPDGRWVIVSVTEPAYDKAETHSDLWLIPADGSGAAKQITHTKAAESGVVFSPNSQQILFSSKRDGDTVEQVYVMELNKPGEARRVTDSALGARAARFSPDGQSIAYVTNMWPGAFSEADNKKLEKEHNESKAKVRAYEQYPVRYWDHWLDERKPHVMLQSLQEGSSATDVFKDCQLLNLPGFQGKLEDGGASLDFAFTPDGSQIIFAATTEMDQSVRAVTAMPLWRISIHGGQATRLTPQPDQYADVQLSPDRQFLYALRNLASSHVYSHSHVVRFTVNSTANGVTLGEADDLMAGLDRSASGYSIAPDGSVAVNVEEAGLDVIYLAKSKQAPIKLYPQTHGVYSSVQLTGDFAHPRIIARYETATSPAEVVAVERAGDNHFLTAFASVDAEKLDLTPLESFSFKDSHGHMIHNWLVKPTQFDPSKKYPLIVLMHGGPASMWKDQISLRWNYHLIAGSQYVMVLTDYKGSTGYGEAFANAIEKDPLKGPADEINQAADEAIKRYPFIDGSRQCAAGASYGGHLANWMQASTHRYKCLVSHAGLVDLTEQWGTSDSNYHREVMVGSPPWQANPLWQTQSPLHYAKDFKTPVLVTVGEKDARVPLPNTLTYWAALQRQQVPSRLLVFPDENHWILNADNSKRYYQELAQWFDKYLGH